MIIVLSFLGLIALLIIANEIYTAFNSAPFLGSPPRIIREALKLADLKENEMLYDLGCGDGRVLIIGVQEFKVKARGYELSFLRYLISKINILRHGFQKRAKVFFKNLYTADLNEADVIYLWLTPKSHIGLKEKFERELKIGSRIVVYSSALPFYEPDKTIEIKPSKKKFFGLSPFWEDSGPLYLYIKK